MVRAMGRNSRSRRRTDCSPSRITAGTFVPYITNIWRTDVHSGILVVSSRPIDQLDIRVALALDWIAMLPDHRSMLFRWNDFQQRLIRGERIPDSDYTEEDVRRALGHPA